MIDSPFSLSLVFLQWLQAGKAALISFYETLRVEFGSDIGITIVTPGLITTDMVQGEAFTSEVSEISVFPVVFFYYFYYFYFLCISKTNRIFLNRSLGASGIYSG